MSVIRKIDLMHQKFGINKDHLCRECSHYCRIQACGKSVRKCSVYGNTRSEASDWVGKYIACGMYDKPYKGRNVIREVTPGREKKPSEEPLEGQIRFF